MHPDSGFQVTVNLTAWIRKKAVMSLSADMTSSSFFDVVFLLSSLVTGPIFMSISWLSRVITIFVYKGLTRKFLLIFWRLGASKGYRIWHKILLNSAKCQGYSFYHFWVVSGKPTGRVFEVFLQYSAFYYLDKFIFLGSRLMCLYCLFYICTPPAGANTEFIKYINVIYI